MKAQLWPFGVGLLLALVALGCNNSPPANNAAGIAGGNQQAEQGQRGHVDVGGSVTINVLIAQFQLWFTVRDTDVLVIQAYDWVSRQVRYLLNGEERAVTLTEQQAADLKQAVDAQKASRQ